MRLWPLALYALAVFGVVLSMAVVSHFLGARGVSEAGSTPYEGGVPITGAARRRYPAHFYQVAVFFVVFDLEVAFLFAWAVAARDLGWSGMVEVSVFVGVLLAALFYLWRTQALEPGPPPRAGGPREGVSR